MGDNEQEAAKVPEYHALLRLIKEHALAEMPINAETVGASYNAYSAVCNALQSVYNALHDARAQLARYEAAQGSDAVETVMRLARDFAEEYCANMHPEPRVEFGYREGNDKELAEVTEALRSGIAGIVAERNKAREDFEHEHNLADDYCRKMVEAREQLAAANAAIVDLARDLESLYGGDTCTDGTCENPLCAHAPAIEAARKAKEK